MSNQTNKASDSKVIDPLKAAIEKYKAQQKAAIAAAEQIAKDRARGIIK